MKRLRRCIGTQSGLETRSRNPSIICSPFSHPRFRTSLHSLRISFPFNSHAHPRIPSASECPCTILMRGLNFLSYSLLLVAVYTTFSFFFCTVYAIFSYRSPYFCLFKKFFYFWFIFSVCYELSLVVLQLR